MNDQHFPTMMRLLFASVVILGLVAVLGLPAFFSAAAIGPLVYYHYRILAPTAKGGLSTSAVDSVYYFGFLVTVVALAISAIHIASSLQDVDMTAVVLQFGVGLFATGYAIFARMHLQSLATIAGVYTPEEIMDRYMERSARLVEHIETSTSRLSTFATEVISRTAAAAETIQQTAEKNMIRTSEKFTGDVAGILTNVRAALDGIQLLVTDPESQSARARFSAELRETFQASSQLNTAMRELAKRTAEEAQQRAETMVATKNLASHLQDFSVKLRQLGAADGAMAVSTKALESISTSLVSSSNTVIGALDNLREVGSLIQDTGPTFVKIRTVAKKAAEQLAVLVDATEHLRSAGENVHFASNASSALNGELTRMRDLLPVLHASGMQLTSSMDSAGKSAQEFDDKISAIPVALDAVNALKKGMSSALTQITDDLKHASQQSREVRDNSAMSAATVEGASALLAGAARLDDTVSAIQHRMTGLLEAIGSVNAAMHATSEEFESFASNYKDQPTSGQPVEAANTPPRDLSSQPDQPEETLP